jgi:hypothetical protein
MKRIILLGLLAFFFFNTGLGQESVKPGKGIFIGFNGLLPRGLAPSTALTNSGSPIEKSYGVGMTIQKEVFKNFSVYFDFNTHNYNNHLADKGEDVQSIWTVAESATHWDEPGAPHIQYVNDLPTDVHFDMQATGFRLGGKYAFGQGKARPWIGAAFGFYEWEANYFNETKDKTYGGDRGYVTGLTFLGGVDFNIMDDVILTAFADMASPVAEYTIEGLFYPQWDITNYQAHIMGPYRFGVTLSFNASKKK